MNCIRLGKSLQFDSRSDLLRIMSVERITQTVEDFIKSGESEILLIKGKWGAGKTYYWNNLIKQISKNGDVALSSYSYVTLFGIDSLETLKNSIIANQINSLSIGKNAFTSSSVLFSDIKNLFKFWEKSPYFRNFTGGLGSELIFQTVKDSIICFDDLERRSDSLDISQILGLASLLKEQRNCKLVIISNSDSLSDDSKREFSRLSEKLIDIELTFAPTPENALNYVFHENEPFFKLVEFCCLTLQIENVRILQRISRSIKMLSPHLAGLENVVAQDVIRSTILYFWSYYDKEGEVISFDFLKDYNGLSLSVGFNKEKLSQEDENKSKLLAEYGYMLTDSFDHQIMKFVEKGFLNDEFFDELQKKNELVIAQKGRDLFREAWDLYRDSFEDNAEEFAVQLARSFEKNVDFIGLDTADESIGILRQLGKNSEADALVDIYVDKHRDHLGADILRTIFFQNLKDAHLRSKLQESVGNIKYDFEFGEVIKEIAFQEFPEQSKLRFLAAYDEESFYEFYKSVNSKDLYWYVKGCLRMGEFQPSDEFCQQLSETVKQVCRRIASENEINRIRIKNWFGIAEDSELNEQELKEES